MKFLQIALSGGTMTLFNSVTILPDRVADQKNFVCEP